MKKLLFLLIGILILITPLLISFNVHAGDSKLYNGPFENRILYIWNTPDMTHNFYMNCDENDLYNDRESESGYAFTADGQINLIAEQDPYDASKNIYFDTSKEIVIHIHAELNGSIESITAYLFHTSMGDDTLIGSGEPDFDSNNDIYIFRFRPNEEVTPNHLVFRFCVKVLVVGLEYTLYTDGQSNITLPLLKDTDSDGIMDKYDDDDDNDGIPDDEEESSGSDPQDPDTDDDGYNDNVDVNPTDETQWDDEEDSDNGGAPGFETIFFIIGILIIIFIYKKRKLI